MGPSSSRSTFLTVKMMSSSEHARKIGFALSEVVLKDDEALMQLAEVRSWVGDSIAATGPSMKSYERPARWGYSVLPIT
jgi:hypothetical protein